MLYSFQKGSQFLEDLNYFTVTKFEMGMYSLKRVFDFVANSTKCKTWQDVKSSHKIENHEVTIRNTDLFGMMILLASGIGGALIMMVLELVVKAKHQN